MGGVDPVKDVFVDTSGFYALLDRTDSFHEVSARLFLKAEREGWHLITSSFVLHESWALIQVRLGWDAVEDWLGSVVPAVRLSGLIRHFIRRLQHEPGRPGNGA